MAKMCKYEMNDNIITTPPCSLKYDKHGLGSAFYEAMSQHGDGVAQIDAITGMKETFSSLLRRSIRTAIVMRNRGLKQGDIISICSGNTMDSCVPFIAAQFLGVIVSSLDPILSLADTTHLLKQVDVKFVFVTEDRVELIEEALKANVKSAKLVVFGESELHAKFSEFVMKQDGEDEFIPVIVDMNETAVIFFSSGTSGLPKGIEISHFSLFTRKEKSNMVWLSFSRLYWIGGVQCLNFSIMTGAVRLIWDDFNVVDVWKYLDKYKVSVLVLGSTYILEMLKAGRPELLKLSNIIGICIAGTSITEESLNDLYKMFPMTVIVIPYGCTETAGVIIDFNPKCLEDFLFIQSKGVSVGQPMDGNSYKIVDVETEERLGPNQRGELRLKCSTIMNGYYKMDNIDTFDSDGWFKTGDIGYYDEDACFYIVDRIKELIKYRGLHVVPAKLETILMSHPDIVGAVVIGYPDEIDNEHPMGIIHKREGSKLTEEEVVKYVNDRVDFTHYIRAGVKFVDSLPYTPSGKVKRNVLKQHFCNISL